MIRVIRTATLRALREEIAEADEAADRYSADADRWNELYVAECARADEAAERADLATEERDQQFEGLHAVIRQVTAERDTARDEADAVAGVRADLDKLLADVTDEANGSSVRGAIALGVLRRLYEEAQTPGRTGAPLDLVAVILGFQPLPARPAAHAEMPKEINK